MSNRTLTASPFKGLARLLAGLILAANLSAAPRGIRNNNAGNIAAPSHGRLWSGAVGVDDAGYMVFRTASIGLVAIITNLKAYHTKHGIDTPAGVVARWTNISDTPEQRKAYTAFICARIGAGPNQRLDMTDPVILVGLMKSIVFYENGMDPYTAKDYKAAIRKAKR